MALHPTALDTFFASLPIAKATFECPESLEMSESGAGDLLDGPTSASGCGRAR